MSEFDISELLNKIHCQLTEFFNKNSCSHKLAQKRHFLIKKKLFTHSARSVLIIKFNTLKCTCLMNNLIDKWHFTFSPSASRIRVSIGWYSSTICHAFLRFIHSRCGGMKIMNFFVFFWPVIFFLRGVRDLCNKITITLFFLSLKHA